MVGVEVVPSLYRKISKHFKKDSVKVFQFLKSLEKEPAKGKPLGTVGGVLVKELKYGSFRFYFVTDGYVLKLFDKEKLESLLIRFVRMSHKKEQQKVINEIKEVLRAIGPSGFK